MRCTILSWACLSLLMPPAAPAQDVDKVLASVVRISGTRQDTPIRGSGFVVAAGQGVATDGVGYLLLVDWDRMTLADNPELAD